jgi:hypothetical protein
MGNYDGNGTWELVEATTSHWSTNGGRGVIDFAAPTTISGGPNTPVRLAVPARYDGNETTKPAWYRPADAMWFVEGPDPVQYGAAVDPAGPPQFDVPVPGDYDGDGVDELAVYHPSDSTFHVDGDPTPIHVGQVGDLPAPADFDGDGTTDPATVTVDTGGVATWHFVGRPDIVYPTTALHPTGPDDQLLVLPAAANYDGNAGDDLAVADLNDTTNHSTWRISTMGDLDLGPSQTAGVAGADLPGPASFNDLLAMVSIAQTKTYCATHAC